MSATGRADQTLDVIHLLTARGVFLSTSGLIVYAAAPECENTDEIEQMIAPFRQEMVALLPLGYPWEARPLQLNVEIAEQRMGSPVHASNVSVCVSSYRPAEPPEVSP